MCNRKCSNCCNIVKGNAVVNGTEVDITLTFSKIESVLNDQLICFVITNTIPDEILPVYLIINGNKYMFINKCGNFVYSDQIKSRTLYCSRIKTDTNLAKNMKCNLLPTLATILPDEPIATPTGVE